MRIEIPGEEYYTQRIVPFNESEKGRSEIEEVLSLLREAGVRGRVLDAGCGPGLNVARMREAEPSWTVLGADYSPAGVGIAARRVGGAFLNADAHHLCFPDAAFADVRQPGFVEPLLRYFDGELQALDAVACDPGGTPFQSRVWTALRTIPVGTTWSYGELARRLGDPKAVRAVGFANGSNPIAVAVPCHRVIGSDGTLVGYGGGLERKRWLLAHEGALPAEQAALFP